MDQSFDNNFDKRAERLYGLWEGIIKDNSDFQTMGRLEVWIPELCSPNETITVKYASPFAGATNPNNISNDVTSYDGTQKSYGFWGVPPDINNIVLVMFTNGLLSRGYWIASVYQQNMNHMVPNIPVGDNYQYDTKVPTAEYNKNSPQSTQGTNKIKKPYYKPQYEGIRNQGLKDDKIRGFSQHGSTSENTSKVLGMLSPNGHYWSLEDTTDDEKIRLRTRSGVQLLLDESNGLVYVINKTGTGWVEVDENGKIMIYGETGIGMRSKGDINFYADNDLIFEAGRNIFMKSTGNMNLENYSYYSKSKNEMVLNVQNLMTETVGKKHISSNDDVQILATNDFNIGGKNVNMNAQTEANVTGSDVNVKALSSATMSSSAAFSIVSGATLSQIASGTLVQSGSTIMQNAGGGGSSAKSASSANPNTIAIPDMATFSKKDVTQPQSDAAVQYTDVNTIVTIYPTHEPCPDHGLTPNKRS